VKDKYRNYLHLGLTAFLVIIASITFWFILNRFEVLHSIANKIFSILTPITYGAVMAFLVAPIYNRSTNFLNKFFKKIKFLKGKEYRWSKAIATFVCLIVIVGIVIALVMMLIPQIIKSISDVAKTLPADMDRWSESIYNLLNNYPEAREYVVGYLVNIDDSINNFLANNILPNLNTYISNVSSGFINIIKQVFNVIIGLIVMTYLLNIKLSLSAQVKRLLYSFLPVGVANIVVEETRYIKRVFSQFIVGKIIDSLIIGIINYVFMSLIHMKYSLLISVVVGVTNVIPFFGPFIGAIPSIFILLLVSPIQALQFAIWILILQQIDGNIIGPKILGQTTGLPSFWILFSILLFGGIFGIVGMIIGVPTFAIVYRFLSRQSALALAKKDLSTESESYLNLNYIDKETKVYVKTDEEV
jgi:hypothetical protein